MIKRLLLIAALLVAPIAATQVTNVQAAVNEDFEYSYFCHHSAAFANPYQVKPFSQTYAEIDGEGQNDHTKHTGAVFNPQVHSQQNNTWGDIIPPVEGVLPNGYNWTQEGQAIYFNDCNYGDETPTAIISWDVSCAVVEGTDMIQVTVTNDGDADGKVYINGQEVAVAAGETEALYFADGTNVQIYLANEELVYDETLQCADTPVVPEDPTTPEEGEVLGAQSADADKVAAMPETSNGTAAIAIVSLASTAAIVMAAAGKTLLAKFDR